MQISTSEIQNEFFPLLEMRNRSSKPESTIEYDPVAGEILSHIDGINYFIFYPEGIPKIKSPSWPRQVDLMWLFENRYSWLRIKALKSRIKFYKKVLVKPEYYSINLDRHEYSNISSHGLKKVIERLERNQLILEQRFLSCFRLFGKTGFDEEAMIALGVSQDKNPKLNVKYIISGKKAKLSIGQLAKNGHSLDLCADPNGRHGAEGETPLIHDELDLFMYPTDIGFRH